MLTFEMAEAMARGERRRAGLTFTVLYEQRCPLCRRLRAWLAQQATVAPIEFVAAGSPQAQARFPVLDHRRTTHVLTVVASDGAVYEGERAWLVCAWGLPRWQPVAEQPSGGGGRWIVRLGARMVDRYRYRHHHRLGHGAGATCRACSIATPAVDVPGRPW
jgi:predicted DCC family thiol-disulfide oxidoreductase YuxK